MDATPLLTEVARCLEEHHLEAVLIGNAAAALQGAPVTTIDFDFLFRKTPRNMAKLRAVATALDATILRPYYPVSDLFRVSRDLDGLQVDFMATIHGVRSFAGLKARATVVDVAGVMLLVAPLADIIASKRAARRPQDLAVLRKRPMKERNPPRAARLAALARANERQLADLIDRWQRLPPGRRTNFLRKRLAQGRSAL